MTRLIVVSNRVAIPSADTSQTGGLAIGIESALRDRGGLWFGWSGKLADSGEPQRHRKVRGRIEYQTLDLPKAAFQGYYNGFSNQVLWPLAHRRPDLVCYRAEDYRDYLRINALFATELKSLLRPGDAIWVHDYHLMPLAQALRALDVGNRIGFFLHTPFAEPYEMMRLPIADSLADFLCQYDLAGFQTPGDVEAFRRFLIATRISKTDCLSHQAKPPRSAAFPIGVETQDFHKLAAEAKIVDPALAAMFAHLGNNVQPVIAVDRLDYSKGVPEHFQAFAALLDSNPELVGRVSLVQVAPPTRTDIPAYRCEAIRAKRAFADLKAIHDCDNAVPAQFLNRGVDRTSLAAAYHRSRVGLVTPLRDGMNLVAKEYVAAQDRFNPGVLVLSGFAGAARELSAGALIVDPRNKVDMANAIRRALRMDTHERRERWLAMMSAMKANGAIEWSSSFMAALMDLDQDVAIRSLPERVYEDVQATRANTARLDRLPI